MKIIAEMSSLKIPAYNHPLARVSLTLETLSHVQQMLECVEESNRMLLDRFFSEQIPSRRQFHIVGSWFDGSMLDLGDEVEVEITQQEIERSIEPLKFFLQQPNEHYEPESIKVEAIHNRTKGITISRAQSSHFYLVTDREIEIEREPLLLQPYDDGRGVTRGLRGVGSRWFVVGTIVSLIIIVLIVIIGILA